MKKRGPVLTYIIITSAIFLIVITFLIRDNVIRLIGAEATISRQNRQIEYYQKENARLEEEVNSLSTDKDTLERFAREKFNFAAPGEDVYIIEDE